MVTKASKQKSSEKSGKSVQEASLPVPQMDTATLRRNRPVVETEPEPQPRPITAGNVGKALDLAFNPSREMAKAFTVIDRMQGRLFPQLDMINIARGYVLEIAAYREGRDSYTRAYKRDKPVPPNLLDEFLFSTAQWSKSVGGKNLEKIVDITLAETETRAGEEEGLGGTDGWKE